MNKLGLSTAGVRALEAVYASSAILDTTVSVLTMDGNQVADLSTTVVDGQVLVDRNARRATRALTMNLADPTGSLDFDPDSAADNALWLSHMVQVAATVWVPAVNDWVSCPYFTGPVTRLWRDGTTVHVLAQGKERRALRDLWSPLSIVRDTLKVDAIRMIMGRTGETLFAFPDSTEMLPQDIGLGRGAKPWIAAQSIAESMNMQLYYRADGYLTLRPWSSVPVHTFSTNTDTGDVSGTPRIQFGLDDDFANTIEVLGGKPSATAPRIRKVLYAPPTHSLSRETLAVNGDPQTGVIVYTYDNPQIRSNAQAEAVGGRILTDRLLSVVKPRFDSVPWFHLEEGDFVQLDTDDTMVPFRLDRFSLPVHTKGRHVMTVGYHDKTTVDRWAS